MSKKKPERSIRLSQGITTYGVGAIVGIGEESFINEDIRKWIGNDEMMTTIRFPRLAQRLNVLEFRHPKPKQYRKWGGKFSFFRFPRWLFCPSCRRMEKITFERAKELDGATPTCLNQSCSGYGKKELLPMRFVVVCENGHIDDFPWWRWAHSKTDRSTHGNCQRYDRLKFITRSGAGASWDALIVQCKCGASRSLGGLENKDALKEIGHQCSGRQPWQRRNTATKCDETPQMVQRNASNIYQPNIISAIDIPQIMDKTKESEEDDLIERIRTHQHFLTCRDIFESAPSRDNPGAKAIIQMISSDLECSIDDVFKVLEGNGPQQHDREPENRTTYQLKTLLQHEEWIVFFHDIEEKTFINIKEELHGQNMIEKSLSSFFNHVSLVKRLKEVRAFNGFNRVKFDPGKTISPSLGRRTSWLPAIEVYGEGIFISFDKTQIDKWYETHQKKIDERFSLVRKAYEKREMEERFGPFSIKFILLHTFSHILIRQLAFESGYSSSSLREAIYFSEDTDMPMTGVLIYTADSDSEGSLGGLVRQGESERLLPTMIVALQRALWCSADPVCRESRGQGQDGLNKAACHACSLISETSCTHFNTLLDRTLLIDEEIGFFKELYQEMRDTK